MCLAIPGKIISIDGTDSLTRMGKVDFGGVTREACLAYVPEAKVGDYVIVHVGFALSVVGEAEAQTVFQYLREMEELSELDSPDLSPPISNSPLQARHGQHAHVTPLSLQPRHGQDAHVTSPARTPARDP